MEELEEDGDGVIGRLELGSNKELEDAPNYPVFADTLWDNELPDRGAESAFPPSRYTYQDFFHKPGKLGQQSVAD
jgi:hypothetical protein